MKYLFEIILGLILISSCQSKKGEHDQKEQNANTFYTCSMDPQVKEDKPGKCPICHMDLTPMKAVSANKDEIELSDQQIKLGNIHTVLVEESNNILQEKFTGVLAINQEKTNSIASRVMGRIEKLYVKAVGDYIQVNSPVYEIYSEDLAILKRDYLLAIKQSKIEGNFKNTAEAMKEAARQKMLLFGLSESLIEKIAASNDQSPNVTFLSPYSGYVTELNFSEGGYVMEGASIMQLAPLNSLWVEAQINVNYIGKISIDQTSKITFPDFPSKTYTGKITFLNPEVNPNTRLVLIRVEVNNSDLTLKPGMQGIVEINQPNLKGFFLPINSVIREENASYVWLEKEKGIYKNVMVMLGEEINGMIEIKSGLAKGDKVVVSGAYAINSEYKFRKGANPMEGMDM